MKTLEQGKLTKSSGEPLEHDDWRKEQEAIAAAEEKANAEMTSAAPAKRTTHPAAPVK